jgi:hypothetical protein
MATHPWERSSSGTRRSKLEREVMTPSYTHASESYALIGHESALFHISHVSVLPRCSFDTSPFSPPCYLMVNMRLIVLCIMWYSPCSVLGRFGSYTASLVLFKTWSSYPGSVVKSLVLYFHFPSRNPIALLSYSCGYKAETRIRILPIPFFYSKAFDLAA